MGDCKGPMWMLVNTTIFDTLDNVIQMVDAMDDQLKVKRGEYCDDDPSPPPTTDSNCEWEEYEETRNYLVKVIMRMMIRMTSMMRMMTMMGMMGMMMAMSGRSTRR